MAEARRIWIRWIVVGALCLGAGGRAFAQFSADGSRPPRFAQVQSPQSGSLTGRLTDLHSAPLVGVSVVLRNQATGAEVHTTTTKNGAFRFAPLDAGEYTLEAQTAGLGHGRLDGILVSGGSEARVQAAMQFEPAPSGQAAAPALLKAAAPPHQAAVAAAAAPSEALTASVPPAAPSAPPAASSQAIALARKPPVAAHPALDTASPALTASISNEPLLPMPLPASRATDITLSPPPQPATPQAPLHSTTQAHAPMQAAPRAQPPAASVAAAPAAIGLTFASPRAALETQSVATQDEIALAQPRTLSLKAVVTPALAAAVPASALQAVLLNPPPVAASVTATQKPDPVTPAITTTVTVAQLQALPASGRRWQEFLLDMPAASASTDSSQASFRGSQESAEITVDGANMRLAFGTAAASGSRASDSESEGVDQQGSMNQPGTPTWSGGRGYGVSEAAIRDITTAAGNVEADGTHSSGGRTTIHTDSGGNALHGQGFLFDRQNTWGARNPFTQWVTETAPASEVGLEPTVPVFDNGPTGAPESYTPPDHEIVWGLGMGSRIRRDKLFWFTALDSYHRDDPGLAMVKHPYLQPPSGCATLPCTSTTTTGFFAQPSDAQMELLCAQLGLTDPSWPGQVCPNPVVEGLTVYSTMLETLSGLLGPAPRTAAQWVGFGRIDWQAAERHHFTLEGIGADWNSPGGGLTGVSANYGNHSFGSSQANEQWLLARWEAYLTPNLLTVTQGSAGHTILTARPDTPSAFEQMFLPGSAYGQLPEIVVDNRYGLTIGNPSRFGQGDYLDEHLVHGQEMLDWVHTRLLVKAGFEIDHDADATSLLRNQTGTYVYSKVENFASDALAFEKFGLTNLLNPQNPHNCDPTGKVWNASNGQLMGLGALPCYSHYSQMIGPTNWNLSTNDWAGYVTAQWQLNKLAVFSAGLRWEREQLPPPLAALANSDLPQTGKMPDLGNNLGPRVSLAIGDARGRWPVLRLGYGMYYGRVENATIETALTQTGSLKGDLGYFIRPTDGYTSVDGTSAAPPFPYVLTGPPSSVVKPSVVEFAPNFRNPEIHQAVAAIEQPLPDRIELTASAMLSLGRRLPVYIDTNIDPAVNPQNITYTVCDETPPTPSGSSNTNGACGNLGLGPIKATQITVPFYASWPSNSDPSPNCPDDSPTNNALGPYGWCNPNYQQTDQITSKANSTYEAAMIKLARYGSRGLSLHAHYTYAHATDWNPNESPLEPANFSQEYGTSDLDVRHSAAVMLIYEAPWKLRNFAGRLANGWMLSGIGQFHSGLPYTMRVTGSLPEETQNSPGSSGNIIVGLRPGMNGSGGDNRVYGLGNDGQLYNIGRNTFRYPDTWKADLRLGKKFNIGEMRELEVLAESFNLFNHQNVTEIETTGYTIEPGSSTSPPTLNFLTGLKTSSTSGLPIPAFGQPLNINATDFYRERQIELGLRMRF